LLSEALTVGDVPSLQAADPGLTSQWADLAERVGAPPFLRPGWVHAWCGAFVDRPLRTATVWREGRLAAILPLIADGRVLTSPANAHSPVFGVLAENAGAVEELLGVLLRTHARRIHLQRVDPEAIDVTLWRDAAAAARYQLRAVPQIHSPYVDVSGDWEAFQSGLRPGRRRELGRRRRRLQEHGEVSIDIVSQGEGIDPALAEGFSLEAAGWKGERGSAILSNPRTQRFYTEVAHWAASQGWLRLTFLRVGNRAVAFDFNLEAGNRLYKLKTGYDPAFRAYGPGLLLTYEVVKAAFASEVTTYELLGGKEPWKLELSDGIRPRVRLRLFAPSLAGRLDGATYTYGRVVKRRAVMLTRALRERRSAKASGNQVVGR
jgi:CelD/BcsL family acetyltransferase involved in cellulose biosynthesis